MKTCKELTVDESYLGDASTLDKVCWVRDGRADRLAVKREGTDAKGGQPSNVDLAPLAVIGCIDDDDFWMSPDAGYRKGLPIWRDLADVKALCAVRAADEPVIKSDFAAVLKNLASMQGNLVSRPSYQVKKDFTLPDNGSGKRFKIRHVLFEVSWTHAVVCLPNTFPQALSKLLPEGDEEDNATDGENGSGGGVADRRAYLLHSKSTGVSLSFPWQPSPWKTGPCWTTPCVRS